jgi:serine/threonine-protein kinase
MERRLDNRPLKSPKEINRNLSEHINTAITQGMALEKENRPQSMSDWLQKLELPPPAVEPQYRQETVNPPRLVKPEKKPEVVQQKPKVNRRSTQNPIQEKLKDIPWGWLIGVFLVYGLNGYILGINSPAWQVVALVLVLVLFLALAGASLGATLGALAGASASAGTVAGGGAGSGALALALAGGGAGTGTVTGTGVLVLAWAFAFALAFGAGAGTWAGVVVVDKLLKHFSHFHSSLIIAGTNLSGLGSGWLLGFFLHPKG